MLLEAWIIEILCVKNYYYQFRFLQAIEDKTGDTFLRHSVFLHLSAAA